MTEGVLCHNSGVSDFKENLRRSILGRFARRIYRRIRGKLFSCYYLPEFCDDKQLALQLLRGEGIEIGALHNPAQAPHLCIKYVDRYSFEELLKQYPEVKDEGITKPDLVCDGETLDAIPDNSQDFVIAKHLLEHLRNPIRALFSWQRVLKPRGRLFLSIPDKRYTFDKNRKLTSLEHLLDDFYSPSLERDFEAFLEYSLYVSCREFKLCTEENYKGFAEELFRKGYSIHYHVWTQESFFDLLKLLASAYPSWKMRLISWMPVYSTEFVYILEKADKNA